MRYAVLLSALVAVGFTTSSREAEAQSRQFYCGEESFVTVTVTGNTIVAGPIDGQMMTMQPSPDRPMEFFFNDYGLIISPDQTVITLEIPDFGEIKCEFGAGANVPQPPEPAVPVQPPVANGPSREFFCGEDSYVTVTPVSATSIHAGPIDGQMLTMEQSPTQPLEFYYQYYGLVVSPDQTQISIEIPDFGTIQCTYGAGADVPEPPPASAASFPMQAKSWGGSVRSGPGVDYKKVGSLAEGEVITLLEPAVGPLYQDRPWFRIRFRGQTGYQWGGIVCGIDAPIPGAFEVCR